MDSGATEALARPCVITNLGHIAMPTVRLRIVRLEAERSRYFGYLGNSRRELDTARENIPSSGLMRTVLIQVSQDNPCSDFGTYNSILGS